jgi:hypothetical protein
VKQPAQFLIMGVVILASAVLIGLGKLPGDSWKLVLGGLGLYLAPSPIVADISK